MKKQLLYFILLLFLSLQAFSQVRGLTQSAEKVCVGELVRLTATGCDKKVVWSNGAIGNSVVDTVKRNITYTALCMEGENVTFNFGINLTVSAIQKPLTPYLMCNNDVIKKGKSTSIKTFGCDGSVKWSNGVIGREINVSPEITTTYTALCTNEAGCSAEPISRTIIVYENKAELEPTISWRYACNGETAVLKADGCTAGTYVWYKNTSILGSVTKNEEIGRGNEVLVSVGGNDVYYTARCQFSDCLGNESNRLQIAFVSKLEKPTVLKELVLSSTQNKVDLNTALSKPYSSGGVFEFRIADDITTQKVADATQVATVGTYFAVERSRFGNCVSAASAIKVTNGQPTSNGTTPTTVATTIPPTNNGAPTEINNQTTQITDTGATIESLEPNDKLDDLGIPGGFSPNGDGVNDKFFIKFLGDKKADLRVYNRYGHLVYEAKKYDNSWNGTPNTGIFKNSAIGLPDGTYYYSLKLEDGRQRIDFITLAR